MLRKRKWGTQLPLQLCPGNPWQVQEFLGRRCPCTHHGVETGEGVLAHLYFVLWFSDEADSCLALTWPLLYKRPIGFTATLTPCYSCRVDFGPPSCSCVGRTQSFTKGLRMGENISPPQSVKPHLSTIPQPSLHHNLEFLPPGRTSLPPEHYALPTALPVALGSASALSHQVLNSQE